MNVANKIDLSAAVSQYLQTNTGSETSSTDVFAQNTNEPSESNESSSATSYYRQDPRRATTSTQAATTTSPASIAQASSSSSAIITTTTTTTTNASTAPLSSSLTGSNEDTNKRPINFEFFTRHVTETNHPVAHALDEKISSSSDVPTASDDTVLSNATQPSPSPPMRKSIYECSDTDDESENNSSSRSRFFRGQSGSSEDNDDSQDGKNSQSAISTSRDKDMRISSIFLDNDYANGDIDLRLPFKPVMANYIPATEIEASITSHAPIVYKVINPKA